YKPTTQHTNHTTETPTTPHPNTPKTKENRTENQAKIPNYAAIPPLAYSSTVYRSGGATTTGNAATT
ncbi:hypothetical protein QP855_08765, partial [Actinotignum sanguinis]|uniref:hypothetical protein n=1 Tax=Actinotignum sanguinis TaxID=1445614 RepID=UPI00254D18B0